ncbi:MAG: glycosyltransferase family 2 protein [Lachnospiraceae bacterium]
MDKISIVVPTYNEEENIVQIVNEIVEEVTTKLVDYDYELILIDNDSSDNTQTLIRALCQNNEKIKAIFNAKNFGQFNSPYYGICQSTGDCTIMMSADFQDPVELISTMVHYWEEGYKIVCPIKTVDKENRLIRGLRTLYYRLLKRFSNVDMMEHFTGFGLYDSSFVEILRNLNDPTPFLRGIVAELGYKIKEIPYEHAKRKAGKSKNNFWTLYDGAMLSVTSYTKIGLRIATIIGFIASVLCIFSAIFFFVYKLIMWDHFATGMAPVIIIVSLVGAFQLMFIGLLGEYILGINDRIKNRPLVVEEERINFDK